MITSMQKLQYLDALRLVGQGSQRFLRAPRKPASRRHGGWSPQKPHGRNGTLPGLLPRAASRLVTGLSRASCRDASGLAVLMSTGRRARAARPLAPGRAAPRVAGLVRITGPGRQIDIFSHCQARCHRPGGWPARA